MIHALPPIPHPDEQHIEELDHAEREKEAFAGMQQLAGPHGTMMPSRYRILLSQARHVYRNRGVSGVLRAALQYLRERV